MAWTDIIQTLCSVVSAGAACFVLKSIRQAASSLKSQNEAHDCVTVLSVWEKLDQHWCRFRVANQSDQQFEFGQLISYYEMSCGLFRSKIFKTKAAVILYEHLHDVLLLMKKDEAFNVLFDSVRSTPENFENIDWLCSQPKYSHRPNRNR